MKSKENSWCVALGFDKVGLEDAGILSDGKNLIEVVEQIWSQAGLL